MRAFLLFFLFLATAVPAGAAYDYPYLDPYYATITAALLKNDEADKTVNYRDIAIKPLHERDTVPFYGAAQNRLKLRYWFAPAQKGPAPLIVMISGLGGQAGSPYYNYLAYQFVKRGFQVLVFPSPMHYSFALSASRSGYPGVTRADAQDLYAAIQLGISKTHEILGMEYTSVGLLGVSLGALEAAYVGALDEQEKKVNFQRVLMVNPPVDPLFSIHALDALAAKGAGVDHGRVKELEMETLQAGITALIRTPITAPEYFLGLETKLPSTLPEREFLIGSSLQSFLTSLIFTTQQVRDLGLLRAPPATNDAAPRLEEAGHFTFSDYIEKFLLPALSADAGKALTYEDVLPDTGLAGVESFLRESPRARLLHNADDFIVNDAQLAWLKAALGDRMTLYPHGGHIGNIWYPENLATILGTFSSLK